jgi:hypothetical protein
MSRERKSRRNASPPPATNSPGVVVPAKGAWQAGSRAEKLKLLAEAGAITPGTDELSTGAEAFRRVRRLGFHSNSLITGYGNRKGLE